MAISTKYKQSFTFESIVYIKSYDLNWVKKSFKESLSNIFLNESDKEIAIYNKSFITTHGFKLKLNTWLLETFKAAS